MARINLEGVEAWKGGGLIPAGTHTVEITGVEEKTSSNGNPQLEVELRAVGGEADGAQLRDWLTLTAAASGRVRQFLEAVRYEIPTGEFEVPTSQLVGRQCVIVVREELYQGETKNKVRAYEQTQGDLPVSSRTTAAATGSQGSDLPF
jgi:hypothetical protein